MSKGTEYSNHDSRVSSGGAAGVVLHAQCDGHKLRTRGVRSGKWSARSSGRDRQLVARRIAERPFLGHTGRRDYGGSSCKECKEETFEHHLRKIGKEWEQRCVARGGRGRKSLLVWR